jgi:tRNA A37 methylthiotransferase MiaB
VAADLPAHVPDHVARFRAKALRTLIAQKNEAFRRTLLSREIDVLVLEDGSGISSNFIRVTVPHGTPVNQWMKLFVTDLDEDGLQACLQSAA